MADLLVKLYLTLKRDPSLETISLIDSTLNSALVTQSIKIDDIFVLAFMNRNIRGGDGERRSSMQVIKKLFEILPSKTLKVIDLIPHYGYWKDIFILWDELKELEFENKVIDIIKKQLEIDEKDMAEKKTISLLAKYIPRQTRQKHIAVILATKLFPSILKFSDRMKFYRQKITNLNKYLGTTEIKLCEKKYSDIDFAIVPNKAIAKYKNAFLNQKKESKNSVILKPRHPNDQDRVKCASNYNAHMKNVINKTLPNKKYDPTMPNEVYSMIDNIDISIIQENWNKIRGDLILTNVFNKTMVLSDSSASMFGPLRNINTSMSILISEANKTNKIIKYKNGSYFVDFTSYYSLYDKLTIIESYATGYNIDIDLPDVMKLIKQNATSSDDIPKDLLIITDKSFYELIGMNNNIYTDAGNEIVKNQWKTKLDQIKSQFEPYVVPRIIVWNIKVNNTIKEYIDDLNIPGVLMFYGWSENIFKRICKEGFKQYSQYDLLRHKIDDPMYDIIRERLI
jgi:hypothetical protein